MTFRILLSFFSCKNEKGEIYLGLAVGSEPLTYVFARVDSDILDLAKNSDCLPTNIFWWHSYRKYKVEFLSTKDVVSFISQFELGTLLGIESHD